MYGEKFYERYVGALGLDGLRILELDRSNSMFYFDTDYPQPMTGFLLNRFDDYGRSIFRFVLITGDLQYNSSGRVESIEYAIRISSGLEFHRFYFNNPYGDKMYLFDR